MCCKSAQSGLVKSAVCGCSQQHTMNHVVDMRLLTKFEGGLQSLHSAEEGALSWVETTAATALVK